SPVSRNVVPFRPASPVAAALSPTEEAVFGRQNGGGRGKWIGLLVVISLAGGVVLRDRLPAPLVDGVHAAIAHPSQWLADRVAGIRGVPKGHPLPAPPPVAAAPVAPMVPPPATVTLAAPPTAPSPATAGTSAGAASSPPVFSVSSLPVANAAAAAPARAASYTPPPARPRPAPRPAPAAAAAPVAAAAHDSDDEPVRAAPPKPIAKPAPIAPVVTNAAPPPAPGSLDDLIRKAVAADQKKGHAQ
ncbi:MAG TPA: hypothetical protein VK841_09895, partial [Polyangiaceae bacterium]|nr:hypothetical protein [Polyangiaceae bacterium]